MAEATFPPSSGGPQPAVPPPALDSSDTRGRRVWRKAEQILDSPLTGIAPWIVLSVVAGPGRLELAAVLALALSVCAVALDLARGRSLKLLAAFDVAFFLALLIVGLMVSEAGRTWMETWIGEISNLALVAVALGSILVRMPFTLQYAREEVERDVWDSPVFLRVNYAITWAWTGAFVVAAIAGFYGDAVLHDNNNMWTGWVVQIAALLVAIQFTAWYPMVGRAQAVRAAGGVPEPVPSAMNAFLPLTMWLVPLGILALVFDAAPTWVGIVLIVLGVVLHPLAERGDQALKAAQGDS